MDAPVKTVPAHFEHLLPRNSSYMWAMMKAIAGDQTSMQNSQINMSQTTMFAAKIEEAIYQYWNGPNGPLAKDTEAIQADAKGDNTTQENADQSTFNKDSTVASGAENQADGPVQSGQQATSAIASDLQLVAQQAQGVTSIMTTLTQMLGNVIG